MDLLAAYTDTDTPAENVTKHLYRTRRQAFLNDFLVQVPRLRRHDEELLQGALRGLAFIDAHSHLERVHFLIRLVMQNAATIHEVLPTLTYLSALADAVHVLPFLENLQVESKVLEEFRALVDFQSRTRRIRSGTLEAADIEDLVFAEVTKGLEGKRLKIDFDWQALGNGRGCAYHVSEILGPDPEIVEEVDRVLVEHAALVTQAEGGDKVALQRLLSTCLEAIYKKTKSIMDSETVLEAILSHTAIGEKYARRDN